MQKGMTTEVRMHRTSPVPVGGLTIGGGAPIAVQSMTMTDTADAVATAQQCIELAEAGSELVRVTVNQKDAARAVPEIKQRMLDAGVTAPLIGDFHYNGHQLLTRHPDCAVALDKYRINPGNVGTGERRDEQFQTICRVAAEHGKPVRIGVNGGSLNQELVMERMQANTDHDLGDDVGRDHQRVHGDLGRRVNRPRARERADRTADNHLHQGVAPARPRGDLSRARPADLATVASWPDRGGHGNQGPRLVGIGDGNPPERGDRRHDPRFADAEAGRRPARGSVRGVRTAAGARPPVVRTQHHRLSRLRAHHQHDVPGTGGTDPDLRPPA